MHVGFTFKYLFPSPRKFLFRNKFTFKKIHNYLYSQSHLRETRREQKFKPGPQKTNPLVTEGEEGLKQEHGYEVVTGSEEILRVVQITFPLSRHWVTQTDTGVTLTSPTKLISRANVCA